MKSTDDSYSRKNATLRVLVVGDRILTPDNDEGSRRMDWILRILLLHTGRVTFVPHFPYSWPPHDQRLTDDILRLRRMGVDVPDAGVSAEEYIAAYGASYDLVVLSNLYVASRHLERVRQYAPSAFVVHDTVHLHHLQWFREAKATGNLKALQAALRSKKTEVAVARASDAGIVVSPEEKQILSTECPGLPIHVISSVQPVRPPGRSFTKRSGILFVGSFQAIHNVDAVTHFLKAVFPLVHRSLPELEFYIVGSCPPDSFTSEGGGKVVVTGRVDDLAPYFERCRLSVAPLRFGAGIKGKVLASLAFGVPVVATPVGAEGLYLTHGRDVLCVEDDEEFSAAICRLHTDESLWNQLSQNGRLVLQEYFSPERMERDILGLLRSICLGAPERQVNSRKERITAASLRAQ